MRVCSSSPRLDFECSVLFLFEESVWSLRFLFIGLLLTLFFENPVPIISSSFEFFVFENCSFKNYLVSRTLR